MSLEREVDRAIARINRIHETRTPDLTPEDERMVERVWHTPGLESLHPDEPCSICKEETDA